VSLLGLRIPLRVSGQSDAKSPEKSTNSPIHRPDDGAAKADHVLENKPVSTQLFVPRIPSRRGRSRSDPSDVVNLDSTSGDAFPLTVKRPAVGVFFVPCLSKKRFRSFFTRRLYQQQVVIPFNSRRSSFSSRPRVFDRQPSGSTT